MRFYIFKINVYVPIYRLSHTPRHIVIPSNNSSTLVIDVLFIEYVSIQLKIVEKSTPKNVQVKSCK